MGDGVSLSIANQTLEFQAQGSRLLYEADHVDCVPVS
jgi:hypothetical protein